LAPTTGLEAMRARRGTEDVRKLCAGPGRLCQALGITRAQDAHALTVPPFDLAPAKAHPNIVVGPRIGISQAREKPWRFGAAASPFLSKPFPVTQAGRKPRAAE
jgi:DNA-3-methyladenine glycosylase